MPETILQWPNISFMLRQIVSHVTFLTFDFLIYKLLLIMSNYITHTSENINNCIFERDPSCSVMIFFFSSPLSICIFSLTNQLFPQSSPSLPVDIHIRLLVYYIVKISYPTTDMDPENDEDYKARNWMVWKYIVENIHDTRSMHGMDKVMHKYWLF